MTAQDGVPVAIIGGGPVGLALALGLAQHGVRSVVIEKDADPVRESRAFGTWTRTLEIFADWGVLPPILTTGSLVDRLSRMIMILPGRLEATTTSLCIQR